MTKIMSVHENPGGLILLGLAGFGVEVIAFAVVPNLIAVVLLVAFFDYIPHFPHKALGRYQNTRIFESRWLNLLLLGQNYHLIHHMYPRVPWYLYQRVYRRIRPDLEANAAQSLIDAVRGLLDRFEMPYHLTPLREEDIPALANGALKEAHYSFYAVPKYLDQRGCESLIRTLLPVSQASR